MIAPNIEGSGPLSNLPIINGKRYPLWSEIVRRKREWIGGSLIEQSEFGEHRTIIKDIRLEPNGNESAVFVVEGEKFTDSCDVRYLAIDSESSISDIGSIGFLTTFGMSFRIRSKR